MTLFDVDRDPFIYLTNIRKKPKQIIKKITSHVKGAIPTPPWKIGKLERAYVEEIISSPRRFGIIMVIYGGEKTPSQIYEELEVKTPKWLDYPMNKLVSDGLMEETNTGAYALTPVGQRVGKILSEIVERSNI